MAFNYTQLAIRAKQLIERFGRGVTMVKFDESPADANKPWRGDLTPRTSPEATQAVHGAFVEPSAVEQLGFGTSKPEFFDRSTQIMLVAPGPTLTANLEEYDEVVDGTVRWKVTGVETLKPGTMRLLYFIGVAR